MHPSPRNPALLLALLAGCGPGEVASTGSASGSTTGSTTAAASTAESTGAGSTTDADTGTQPDPTTGAPAPCGCDDPQVIDGNLDVAGLAELAGTCIGEIDGMLRIQDVVDPAVLQPLIGLRRVAQLQVYDNPGLVDLSMLGCLEEVTERLDIAENPALVDISALTRVRLARTVELRDLPITALPSFAPDYQGFRALYLYHLPELLDLAPVAGWPRAIPEDVVSITIVDVPKLTGIAELAGPIGAPMPDTTVVLELFDLPALTALTGLEATRDAYLTLGRLPLVKSLAPLSGLSRANNVYLDGMTGLGSLEGLHNLESAEDVRLTGMPGLTSLAGLRALEETFYLQIGGCDEAEGLDGLADLTGLDALTRVDLGLSIIRNAGLVSLAGAPKLGKAGWVDLVDNPKLTADAVADLDAQIDAMHLCFGGEIECACLSEPPDAHMGCPSGWSGGSDVSATGEGGPLAGATAFFGWLHSPPHNELILAIVDAGADIATAKKDGLWNNSDEGSPRLLMVSEIDYQDVIGDHESFVTLAQPGGLKTQAPVHITISGRLGNWSMIDPADPPRLVGEFKVLDPNAATIVEGPFDAAYCDRFSWVSAD